MYFINKNPSTVFFVIDYASLKSFRYEEEWKI